MKLSELTPIDLYSLIMLAFVLVVVSRFIYATYQEPERGLGSRSVIWFGVFIIYIFPALYGVTVLWQ